MLNLFMLGALAFALSYVGVALIRQWALQRNLLDIPNERSSHAMPTPRGGGIAIAIILIAGFALARLWVSELELRAYFGFLLGVMVVASISVIDDLFTLSAGLRLFSHLFAASVFLLFSGYVDRVDLSLVGELNWGWIGVPIVLFWIVGLTNAYNFMDGIDGLAAGQAIVAGSFWIVVCWTLGLPTLTALSVLLVGASLGFLLHNTPPARIFMGDVGSTVLGFTFAALPILAFRAIGDPRLAICGVLSGAPFVFDTALTMLRRASGARSHSRQFCRALLVAAFSPQSETCGERSRTI